MIGLIERSVFLRSLNFLRVKHAYAFRYSVIYPLIGCALVVWTFSVAGEIEDYFKNDGLLANFIPVLSVLAPFFIASLAAVSTFSGPKFFDQKFRMSEKVTLTLTGVGGDQEQIELTPRHFLSLLFGYCSVTSIALLISLILMPVFLAAKSVIPDQIFECIIFGILIAFSFLFIQLILYMLLGIYYLADRVHR